MTEERYDLSYDLQNSILIRSLLTEPIMCDFLYRALSTSAWVKVNNFNLPADEAIVEVLSNKMHLWQCSNRFANDFVSELRNEVMGCYLPRLRMRYAFMRDKKINLIIPELNTIGWVPFKVE